MIDYPIDYKSGDRLPFGKHKGETIDSVAQFDPTYIQWMYDNKICTIDTLHRYHRAEYKKKKFSASYARVFG